jgi:hypothetical protein
VVVKPAPYSYPCCTSTYTDLSLAVLARLLNLPNAFVNNFSASGLIPGLGDLRLAPSRAPASMHWTPVNPTQVYGNDYYRTSANMMTHQGQQQPWSSDETRDDVDTAARIPPGRVTPGAERSDARRAANARAGKSYPSWVYRADEEMSRGRQAAHNPYGGYAHIVTPIPSSAFRRPLAGPVATAEPRVLPQLPSDFDPSRKPYQDHLSNNAKTSSGGPSEVWAVNSTVPPVFTQEAWYGFPDNQARAARDRADAGNTAADRINREAGRERRSEGDGDSGTQ